MLLPVASAVRNIDYSVSNETLYFPGQPCATVTAINDNILEIFRENFEIAITGTSIPGGGALSLPNTPFEVSIEDDEGIYIHNFCTFTSHVFLQLPVLDLKTVQ